MDSLKGKAILFCLFLYIFKSHLTECQKSDTVNDVTNLIHSLTSNGYDKNIRPNYGGPSVNVNVTMYINDISSVSEVQMDFTVDFYFRQLWNDERLAYNTTEHKGIPEVRVGSEFAKKIWVPDTFFINGKQVSLHISTTTDTNTLLRIKPNGDILHSIRLTVVGSCPMNLKYFPMDQQLCRLKVASYGYQSSDIDYFWATGFDSFGLRSGLYLPTFHVVGYNQSKKYKKMSTGNYTRLICEIGFERSIGYYLNQIYIPAFLIVVISWVPFWLDRDDTHARVGLGVTTVLTMTTLITSTNDALPKISYIKSIDIYLNTCFLMVFASLIEYATVGYYETSKKDNHTINTVINDKPPQPVGDKPIKNGLLDTIKPINPRKGDPSRIDRYSRWIFPLTFIIFNLFYWSINVYLNVSQRFKGMIAPEDYK